MGHNKKISGVLRISLRTKF